MKNVLFVTQRWVGLCGWLCDYSHYFIKSISSTGLGSCKEFNWDFELAIGCDLDKSFMDLLTNNKFDIIIFLGYTEECYKFKDTTWEFVKKLTIPVVMCSGDFYPDLFDYSHLKHADLIVMFDTDKYVNKGLKDLPPRWFFPPGILDPGLFFNSDIIRDNDVWFGGGLGLSERPELIGYINSIGLNVKHGGGGRWRIDHYASPFEYALDYMRSKMSISLSHSYTEDYLIGHIFEGMFCGCCTFVNKMRITRSLFTPGIDYVEYTDKYDLADKLIYYMDNEDEAQEIAKNGNIKVQNYNAYNFYTQLFKLVGVGE